jgi:hypothetical protein
LAELHARRAQHRACASPLTTTAQARFHKGGDPYEPINDNDEVQQSDSHPGQEGSAAEGLVDIDETILEVIALARSEGQKDRLSLQSQLLGSGVSP